MNATPRLLAGDNPPDLIRLPSMVELVKDGLLKNLDDYAPRSAGTSGPPPNWPSTASPMTAARLRLAVRDGAELQPDRRVLQQGPGQQIGMTQPPATVAEFDDLLSKAKAADLQPIMQWNATASDGGLAFPLQNLMAAYGPTGPINDWIFQKPGATIDTAANLKATQHLEEWVKAGYFPEDANAIEYTDANARFGKGDGVFMFNGDWENATYDKDMPGNVGFFVFPTGEAGGKVAAMSAPLTYGIAAKAKNADCAAFFFNWVATNETARQINVDVGGSNRWPDRTAGPVGGRGFGDQRDAGRRQRGRQGQRWHGLHRERDGLHLRPGLDSGTAEADRWPAGRRRSAQGGPG